MGVTTISENRSCWVFGSKQDIEEIKKRIDNIYGTLICVKQHSLQSLSYSYCHTTPMS